MLIRCCIVRGGNIIRKRVAATICKEPRSGLLAACRRDKGS